MEVLVIILFLGLGLLIYFMRTSSHESSIRNEINALGGNLISYEKRNFFTGIGPFTIVGKGRIVYRIEYEVSGVRKEGWVRFGSLFGPDWRL